MSKAHPRFRRVNPPLPAIGVNHVYMATFSGTADNDVWHFNISFMGADILGGNSESNIAQSIETTLATPLPKIWDIDTNWLSVKVACLDIPTRQPFTRFVNGGAGYPGTDGFVTTHLPSSCAAVVSKYTAFKGQHGRGRNYFPAVPTNFVVPANGTNILTPGAVAFYQGVVNALEANTIVDAATTMQPCIFTRPQPAGFPVTNAATVQFMIVRTSLGVVRKRRPKGQRA
jgi:hypothetical protein